ncbi:CPBP family intramembrane metalloprotease [Corallococcus sp. CA053C]|uniref:CPBP family intramembrane glutamic endopeptidase n=1 Tax=Corallococcus sp. CA053C TaxID=2316732 RepID=UPI000EA05D03|nr:type II CAAX endopeptidase family protein [Corallococcus sp. CA053C]RKH02539.1 CPBP family intramembrane metalloprotease [Corallococcus sp. CA053C]
MRSWFRDADGRWRNGWKALGCVALTVALLVPLMMLQQQLPASLRPFAPQPFAAFLGALGATALCLRLERQPLSSVGLAGGWRWGRDFGLGLLGGIVLLGSVALVVFGAGGFHLEPAAVRDGTRVVKAAWMMLGVALFEELLFHGYAFQRAIRGMGTRWAQVVLSVIFCLAHPFSGEMGGATRAVAMLTTFLAGWMLGLCYLRTGRLALPVGVHMGWNWFMSCLGFGVSGNESKGWWMPVLHDRPEWLTGGSYGLEASVGSLVMLVVAVVALTLWKGLPSARVPALALSGGPVPPSVLGAGEA